MANPADDLKGALEAAFESHQEPVEEPAPLPEADAQPAPEPTADGPARDEQGRFAKAEKPVSEEGEPEAGAEPAPADVAAPVVEAKKAPSSWKPNAQAAFNALPPEVQDEVLRRESDYHKGIESYKTHAQQAKAFEEAITPYAHNIQAAGVDAPTAVAKLLHADHILRHAAPAEKQQFLARLAMDYGVDLGQAAQLPPPDQQVVQLQRQLEHQQYQMQQYQRMQQEQQNAVVMAELEKFAADPAHSHFEAVKEEMSVLLQTGKATDLKDAYDKAVWMRPDIRQSLIEQQRAEAQRKATEQAQAARAKAANVSVKGSSPAASGVPPVKGSLREQLEASFADHT